MVKMKCSAVLVSLFLQQASGVIYRLNATEYDRLPPLSRLDPYEPCLRRAGDLYCYLDAELVSDTPSPLLDTIREYSAYNTTHFDHTFIHWGVCVRQSCAKHLAGSPPGRRRALEACLNETLSRQYGLRARVRPGHLLCTEYGETVLLDWGDYVVAAVVLTILMLNIIGSCYDFLFNPKTANLGARLVLCFSARRGWRRLTAPAGAGPEPRLARLKCFNGLKAMTTIYVILGHSPLVNFITTNNPLYWETIYHNPLYAMALSGTLVVQTFFVLSGFLLAYNLLVVAERRRLSWTMLPKGVMLRWLRLTPPYALILALVSTWLRHLKFGPLWDPFVNREILDCRREWFLNLFYLNNYIDNSQCMAHSWYLAGDMQLTCLGLAVFCLLRRGRARMAALAVLFVVGLLTPALHTYFQNLSAVLIIKPEVARRIYVEDPTFNNLYKRGHTNIMCYAIGLILGMVIYNLQKQNIDIQKYKTYLPVYYASVPLGMCVIMSGAVFYADGAAVPLAVRALYAAAVKLVYGLLLAVLITGCVFKVETVYRGVVEWRGWAAAGRVSYCAFLLHVPLVRLTAATSTALTRSSFFAIMMTYFSILSMSYLAALPLWLLVESPFCQLVKELTTPPPRAPRPPHPSHTPRPPKPTGEVTLVAVVENETVNVKL